MKRFTNAIACAAILVALPALALAGWTVEDGAATNGRDVFTYTYDFTGEPMLEVEEGSMVIDLGMVGTDVQIISASFEGLVYENFVHTEQETCVGCVDYAPIMYFTIQGANTLSLNVFENGYGGPFSSSASYFGEFASSTQPLQVVLTYINQDRGRDCWANVVEGSFTMELSSATVDTEAASLSLIKSLYR